MTVHVPGMPPVTSDAVFYWFHLLILLALLFPFSDGVVTLTSSAQGAICPGEEVTLTCTVTGGVSLEWSSAAFTPTIRYVENERVGRVVERGIFTATLVSKMANPTPPLLDFISTLKVTSTPEVMLNGTVIICTDQFNPMNRSLTLAGSPSPPMNITNSIQWYGYSNVSVLLQWDPPMNGGGTPVDNYTITVTGPTTQELTSQVTTATITVMYNEMYTLNVRTSNCAGSSSESTTTNIFEAGCGEPRTPRNASLVQLDSAEVGAEVTYQCNAGFIPKAPQVSICAQNITWIPDPEHLVCQEPFPVDCGTPVPPISGLLQPYTNTTEGSMVVFYCNSGLVPEGEMTAVCGSDGQWTPNPGSLNCTASGQIPVAPMVVVVVVVACTCTLLLSCVITIVGFVRFKKHMHPGCSVKIPTAGPRTQSFNRHHQSEMQFPAENIESPSSLRSVMNAKCTQNQSIEAQYSELKATEAMQNQLGISYVELGPQAMSRLVRPPSKQGITVEYSEMQLLQVDSSEIHPVAQNTEELRGYLPISVGMTSLPSSPPDTDDFPPPVPPKYFLEEDHFPPPPKLPLHPCEESKENIALPSFFPTVHQQGTQQSDTAALHPPPKGHLRGTPSNVPPVAPKADCFNRI